MERHGGDQPIVSLTDDQKAALAEVDDKFKAKVAEKEVFLGDLIKKATEVHNYHEVAQIEEQKRREIKKLESERDAAKEAIREKA